LDAGEVSLPATGGTRPPSLAIDSLPDGEQIKGRIIRLECAGLLP
jgi:hypothetical protein